MNKVLRKEIMKRSNLRSKYLKNRSKEDRQMFVKKINLFAFLLRETIKSYYSNLNQRNVIDNQKFWKAKFFKQICQQRKDLLH